MGRPVKWIPLEEFEKLSSKRKRKFRTRMKNYGLIPPSEEQFPNFSISYYGKKISRMTSKSSAKVRKEFEESLGHLPIYERFRAANQWEEEQKGVTYNRQKKNKNRHLG